MELTAEQTQKLKSIELDILKHFINVCEVLHLKYYIIAGTLIGAIRHKGFIPWDDDIDVAMPRSDYDIFVSEAQQYLPSNLFVQTYKTDKEFAFNMAKVRDSTTTFFEKTNKNLKINSGIFIDIFPLDNFLSDPKFSKKASIKIKVYKTSIGRVFYREQKNFKLRINQLLSCILFPSSYKALEAMDKFILSIPPSNMCNNYSSNYGFKEACPWNWFGEGIDVEFEGIMVKAPKEYDLYLSQIYGNYMQLPPREKRISCHKTDIIDLERSYAEYLKE